MVRPIIGDNNLIPQLTALDSNYIAIRKQF
jgi:hypothetical protein